MTSFSLGFISSPSREWNAQHPTLYRWGTRTIFGYRWAAEGLKPWPCLGRKNPKAIWYPVVFRIYFYGNEPFQDHEWCPQDQTREISVRGVTNFSWVVGLAHWPFLSTYILKIAGMASTHWPHQRFELLSLLAHITLTTHNLLQAVEWSNQNLLARAYRFMGCWLLPCQSFSKKIVPTIFRVDHLNY